MITPKISTVKQREIPSKTYMLDFESKRILDTTDGFDAVLQAIRKVFLTERYAYQIYSGEYGIELQKYIAKDYDYLVADLGRSISDCLLSDDRIKSVQSFSFSQVASDMLNISFEIATVDGSQMISMEARI